MSKLYWCILCGTPEGAIHRAACRLYRLEYTVKAHKLPTLPGFGGFPGYPVTQDDLDQAKKLEAEPDLLLTGDEEKLECGKVLKERQSIMDGWDTLRRRGYELAKVKGGPADKPKDSPQVGTGRPKP